MFRHYTKFGAKRLNWCNQCTSLCHKVASEFFTTNAPDPPHWRLNSCFRLFHSVWVHLGSFRCCMKLGAKRAELVQLMQKFVPRSRVGIFRNDSPNPHHRTLNSCFGPFLSVWVHLGLFRYCTKMRQTGAINVKVRATKSCRNFSQRTLPIHTIISCFGAFLSV